MAGYTRQSAADIVPNEIVKSAPVNAEYNALASAFVLATGHKHDGTTAEGAYVPIISDADNDTKIEVESISDEDLIRITISGTEKWQINSSGAIIPTTGATTYIGSTSRTVSKGWFDDIDSSQATFNSLTITSSGSFSISTGATFNANGVRLEDIGEPTSSGDSATKNYVDSQISGAFDLETTSTSSNSIGTGSKTFTLADVLSLSNGQILKLTDSSTGGNWVVGSVTSWNSGTREVVINVGRTDGTGTITSWTANVQGIPGENGLDGADASWSNPTADLDLLDTYRVKRGRLLDMHIDAYDVGTVTGDTTFDWANGSYQYVTVATGATVEFGFTGAVATGDASIMLVEFTNAGQGTVSFASNVVFDGGSVPEHQSSGVDIDGFITRTGTSTGATIRGVRVWKEA